ncbi:MAG: alanine racemase [Acidimicrobiales bacterium]
MTDTSGAEHRTRHRPVWAEIDLDAVAHNVALLSAAVAPARLCAVVKADGYGHGSVDVSRAALEAGASWLAVALVEEGLVLRAAGIEAPVLLLSEPPVAAMDAVVAHDLTPTLYSAAAVDVLDQASAAAGVVTGVHVKVDTGMHRVGADPQMLAAVVKEVAAAEHLRFDALWTHLAVADGVSEEDRAYTATQLERFAAARATLVDLGLEPPLVHAANSAGALAHPAARLDMVRCGISVYGLEPSIELADTVRRACGGKELRPAMTLRAQVSHVRTLDAGVRPSYGRRRPLPERSVVATVPLGYADGVPRRLFECGGEVLVAGKRRPLAGTVTMDQIIVDCGPPGDVDVAVGDEVVLIGAQGHERITAWEWAATMGTIGYEITCGIGARVPRVPVRRGQ